MKKLFSFICILMASLTVLVGAPKKTLPKIIVRKTDGGSSATINRYNTVNYTPGDGETDPIATLDCYGEGLTACRVPRGHTVMANSLGNYNDNTSRRLQDININNRIIDAVNELIEFSETQVTNGKDKGKKSKTIAVNILNTRRYDTFKLDAKWKYDQRGDGSMVISIIPGTLNL